MKAGKKFVESIMKHGADMKTKTLNKVIKKKRINPDKVTEIRKKFVSKRQERSRDSWNSRRSDGGGSRT